MNEKYTKGAVVLHWLVAIGILFNLIAMLVIDDNARTRGFINIHKSVGITVLLLVLLRFLWRAANKPPEPLAALHGWERTLSKVVHYSLYALIVLVPLSGWLHDSAFKDAAKYPLTLFGTIPWFRLPPFTTMEPVAKEHWHTIFGIAHSLVLKILLWIALVLHVAGALKHQFIDKQRELQRMWF